MEENKTSRETNEMALEPLSSIWPGPPSESSERHGMNIPFVMESEGIWTGSTCPKRILCLLRGGLGADEGGREGKKLFLFERKPKKDGEHPRRPVSFLRKLAQPKFGRSSEGEGKSVLTWHSSGDGVGPTLPRGRLSVLSWEKGGEREKMFKGQEPGPA